jgi:hypothetical protein
VDRPASVETRFRGAAPHALDLFTVQPGSSVIEHAPKPDGAVTLPPLGMTLIRYAK